MEYKFAYTLAHVCVYKAAPAMPTLDLWWFQITTCNCTCMCNVNVELL